MLYYIKATSASVTVTLKKGIWSTKSVLQIKNVNFYQMAWTLLLHDVLEWMK